MQQKNVNKTNNKGTSTKAQVKGKNRKTAVLILTINNQQPSVR